jgi:hypothetical protein
LGWCGLFLNRLLWGGGFLAGSEILFPTGRRQLLGFARSRLSSSSYLIQVSFWEEPPPVKSPPLPAPDFKVGLL